MTVQLSQMYYEPAVIAAVETMIAEAACEVVA